MESEDKLLSHLTSELDGRAYSPSSSDNIITEETAHAPSLLGMQLCTQ